MGLASNIIKKQVFLLKNPIQNILERKLKIKNLKKWLVFLDNSYKNLQNQLFINQSESF